VSISPTRVVNLTRVGYDGPMPARPKPMTLAEITATFAAGKCPLRVANERLDAWEQETFGNVRNRSREEADRMT
jgi:hypothetical protein